MLSDDLLLSTGADGGDSDQRGHADDDAESREHGAEPVRAERSERDSPVLDQRRHCAASSTRVGSTGSSETIAPVREAKDARGALGHLVGMRDHDDRRSVAVQALEDREHVLGARRVEVAGRLVQEDDARSDDQRACDGDPLLLAAGELRCRCWARSDEPDLGERLERAARRSRRGTPA